MIVLGEQYGYKGSGTIDDIERFSSLLEKRDYSKSIQRGENTAYCYKVVYSENKSNPYHFETSYFVGVDWIVENSLPIYVKPKLDDDGEEVNFSKMLFDVLKEPENYDHLDQLYEINFEKPTIAISQRQDLLTPLLLIQYINILKRIVQKGLKKSYYPVTKNLNSKLKGKILINDTIKKNHFNNKRLYNYCQYSEFGINSIENRVLKKALEFSISAVQNLPGFDPSLLNGLLQYIMPAFVSVDTEVNIEELRGTTPNAFYKDYEQALKLAKSILKRYGYNISNATSTAVSTPPFWIDMSKLFELFVFSKLKERFPLHNEVTYHQYFNRLQPDFIIKTRDGSIKMVVDAKYKPKYKDKNISVEDIRQVSGYARLRRVYEFLGMDGDKVIDCLVIYSHQTENRENFLGGNFVLVPEDEYNNFYKIGIRLPVKG